MPEDSERPPGGTAPVDEPADEVADAPAETPDDVSTDEVADAPDDPPTDEVAEAPAQPATAGAEAPAAPEEEPDALGVVEEQERIPEEESTIAEPGEAMEELLPALEATGHQGVDDALASLEEMAESSVHDHVEVFDAVHEELRRTLDQAADQ